MFSTRRTSRSSVGETCSQVSSVIHSETPNDHLIQWQCELAQPRYGLEHVSIPRCRPLLPALCPTEQQVGHIALTEDCFRP